MLAKWLQSCPTLCPPVDSSPPGSSVHGILQAGILECIAMPSSKGSSPTQGSNPVSHVSCIGRRVLYYWCHLGSPCGILLSTFIWLFIFFHLRFHPCGFPVNSLDEKEGLYVSFLNLEVVPKNFNVQSAPTFLLQLNVFLSPSLEGNFLCPLLSTCVLH